MIQKVFNQREEKEVREFAEKLAVYYDLFNWRWGWEGEVPDAGQIYRHIRDQYRDLKNNQADSISCGGITVTKDDGCVEVSWDLSKKIWL